MAAFKDKKNGSWYVQFRYVDWKGERQQKLKRGFATKRDALAWEREFLMQKQADINMTFESFVALYEKDIKPKLKLNTWLTKESIIHKKILPYFKSRKLSEISPKDIIAWQNEIRALTDSKGKPYSTTYLKTVHNQLSAIFNHAIRYYGLQINPAQKAGNMGNEKRREMLFWTKDEYLRFSEAMLDKPLSYYAFEVLYWCGIRVGELLALTPADFNFTTGTLTISKSYQRLKGQDVITTPKTPKSNRVIKMPQFLCEEIQDPQIKEELDTMQTSARAMLKTLFPKNDVEIFSLEVGNETIEKWYNASSKQITITDTLDVETPKVGFELTGDKWRAYVTAVSAKWLQQKYATYKDDIFSGNPRTYLGSGKKKNKINLGIMETIDQQPGNFWAYNNGITALVNDYEAPHEGKENLSISGITIINGAQTTGAISSVENLKDAWVPIRFIVCNDANIIDDIINNNNKQNEILPSDLRSNDKTQNRLRAEFAPYTKLYYSGGRRGNVRPSRSKEILDPYVVAQALLAFHGDCVTAYNSKKLR